MDPRIDQLREHLKEEPASRRFFQLGELLRKYGNLEEAMAVFATGLEIHPRYVAAWVSLGRAQAESERWAEAEASLAHALQIDPENAVAARLIGEIAEANGDHERAIKAYQLARALTPGDSDLQEAIERNEAILRGETTAPMDVDPDPETLTDMAPFAEADPFDQVPETEVEVGTEPPSAEDTPFASPPPKRRRPLVPTVMPADDPFAVAPSGDTGVWDLADDVFMTPEAADEVAQALEASPVPEPEPEIEPVPEPEPEAEVFAPEPENDEAFAAAPAFEPEPFAEPVSVPEPTPEVEADEIQEPWVETRPAAEDPTAEETPLPQEDQETLPMHTVTLARLAADQGDVDLARETLEGLLARDPDNIEAGELLRSLEQPPPVEIEVAPAADEPLTRKAMLAAKTSTLKAWMEAVRLAADRRAQ